MLDPIVTEIIRGAVTLTAAGLAAWVALTLYFRQKEYEVIKQRYLEGGVDIVAADIEHALSTTNHNWARCLHLAKVYRDATDAFDPTELTKGFAEFQLSNFNRIGHHRIGSLIGSHVVWEVYQLALSYATNANSKIKEMLETIRLKLTTDRISAEPSQIVSAMFAELKKLDDESHKFASLTRELYALGLMLEREKLSFISIAKFSKRAEVIALVGRLKSEFAQDLAPDQQGNAGLPPCAQPPTPK